MRQFIGPFTSLLQKPFQPSRTPGDPDEDPYGLVETPPVYSGLSQSVGQDIGLPEIPRTPIASTPTTRSWFDEYAPATYAGLRDDPFTGEPIDREPAKPVKVTKAPVPTPAQKFAARMSAFVDEKSEIEREQAAIDAERDQPMNRMGVYRLNERITALNTRAKAFRDEGQQLNAIERAEAKKKYDAETKRAAQKAREDLSWTARTDAILPAQKAPPGPRAAPASRAATSMPVGRVPVENLPGAPPPDTNLPYEGSEPQFQRWYQDIAKAHKLSPNPDDPKQFYDWRAAWAEGAKPDKKGHWPSQFKKPGHPNEVVGGFNTRTGERVPGTKRASEAELVKLGWDAEDAKRLAQLPDVPPTFTGPTIPPELQAKMRAPAALPPAIPRGPKGEKEYRIDPHTGQPILVGRTPGVGEIFDAGMGLIGAGIGTITGTGGAIGEQAFGAMKGHEKEPDTLLGRLKAHGQMILAGQGAAIEPWDVLGNPPDPIQRRSDAERARRAQLGLPDEEYHTLTKKEQLTEEVARRGMNIAARAAMDPTMYAGARVPAAAGEVLAFAFAADGIKNAVEVARDPNATDADVATAYLMAAVQGVPVALRHGPAVAKGAGRIATEVAGTAAAPVVKAMRVGILAAKLSNPLRIPEAIGKAGGAGTHAPVEAMEDIGGSYVPEAYGGPGDLNIPGMIRWSLGDNDLSAIKGRAEAKPPAVSIPHDMTPGAEVQTPHGPARIVALETPNHGIPRVTVRLADGSLGAYRPDVLQVTGAVPVEMLAPGEVIDRVIDAHGNGDAATATQLKDGLLQRIGRALEAQAPMPEAAREALGRVAAAHPEDVGVAQLRDAFQLLHEVRPEAPPAPLQQPNAPTPVVRRPSVIDQLRQRGISDAGIARLTPRQAARILAKDDTATTTWVEGLPSGPALARRSVYIRYRGRTFSFNPGDPAPTEIPPEIAPAPPAPAPEAAPAPPRIPVAGFTTSQGSTYTVEGERTTRNKARTGEQFGPSDRTVYLDPETAGRAQAHINSFGEEGGETSARPQIDTDGNVVIVVKDRATGKINPKLSRRVLGRATPAVGLHPFEVWNKKDGERKWHFGNAITEVRHAPMPAAATYKAPSVAPTSQPAASRPVAPPAHRAAEAKMDALRTGDRIVHENGDTWDVRRTENSRGDVWLTLESGDQTTGAFKRAGGAWHYSSDGGDTVAQHLMRGQVTFEPRTQNVETLRDEPVAGTPETPTHKAGDAVIYNRRAAEVTSVGPEGVTVQVNGESITVPPEEIVADPLSAEEHARLRDLVQQEEAGTLGDGEVEELAHLRQTLSDVMDLTQSDEDIFAALTEDMFADADQAADEGAAKAEQEKAEQEKQAAEEKAAKEKAAEEKAAKVKADKEAADAKKQAADAKKKEAEAPPAAKAWKDMTREERAASILADLGVEAPAASAETTPATPTETPAQRRARRVAETRARRNEPKWMGAPGVSTPDSQLLDDDTPLLRTDEWQRYWAPPSAAASVKKLWQDRSFVTLHREVQRVLEDLLAVFPNVRMRVGADTGTLILRGKVGVHLARRDGSIAILINPLEVLLLPKMNTPERAALYLVNAIIHEITHFDKVGEDEEFAYDVAYNAGLVGGRLMTRAISQLTEAYSDGGFFARLFGQNRLASHLEDALRVYREGQPDDGADVRAGGGPSYIGRPSDSRRPTGGTGARPGRDRAGSDQAAAVAPSADDVLSLVDILSTYEDEGVTDFATVVRSFQTDYGSGARGLDRALEIAWRKATGETVSVDDVLGARRPSQVAADKPRTYTGIGKEFLAALSPEARANVEHHFTKATVSQDVRLLRAAMEVYSLLQSITGEDAAKFEPEEVAAAGAAATQLVAATNQFFGNESYHATGYEGPREAGDIAFQDALHKGIEIATEGQGSLDDLDEWHAGAYVEPTEVGNLIFNTLDPQTASFDVREFHRVYSDVEFRREPDTVFPPVPEAETVTLWTGRSKGEKAPPRDPEKMLPSMPGADHDARRAAGLAQIETWKAEADAEGAKPNNQNYKKMVLSLYDRTGIASEPWARAGYSVRRFDIRTGEDLTDFGKWMEEIEHILAEGYTIVGVIAQPPCTSFTSSGSQHWPSKHDEAGYVDPETGLTWLEKTYGKKAAKNFDTPLDYANTLVAVVKLVIAQANPRFYAMENPVGRINEQHNLPDPVLKFNPDDYGEGWTKATQLWGEFDPNLPLMQVGGYKSEGGKGSIVQNTYGSGDKDERAQTAEGFAYAFFMGNKHLAELPWANQDRPADVEPEGTYAPEDPHAPGFERETPPPVIAFRSGNQTSPIDTAAFIKAGQDVGVTALGMTGPVRTQIVAHVTGGGNAFIDSGAFGKTEIVDGKGRSTINFDAVLSKYDTLAEDIEGEAKRQDQALGNVEGLYVVAPDVAPAFVDPNDHNRIVPRKKGIPSVPRSFPDETKAVQDQYADRILGMIDAGMTVIVPVQVGPNMSARAVEVLEQFRGARIGLPGNQRAISEGQLSEMLTAIEDARVRPEGFHFLGIGDKNKRLDRLVEMVHETFPMAQVTSDSSRANAMFGKGRPAQAQVEARVDQLAGHEADEEVLDYDLSVGLAGEFFRGEWEKFTADELQQVFEAAGVTPAQARQARDEGRLDEVFDKAAGDRQREKIDAIIAGDDDGPIVSEGMEPITAALFGIAHARGLVNKTNTKQARGEVITDRDQKEPTLPRELAGAAPRYNIGTTSYTPTFASDIDRAAYITAHPTPSKRDADYLKFVMDATGMTEAETRAHGTTVRAAIKAIAQATPAGGAITIPRVKRATAPPTSRPVAPRPAAAPAVSGSSNTFRPKSDRLTKDQAVAKEWKSIKAGIGRAEAAFRRVNDYLQSRTPVNPKDLAAVQKAATIYDDFKAFFDRYDMPEIDQWSRWQRAQDDATHLLARANKTGHFAEPGRPITSQAQPPAPVTDADIEQADKNLKMRGTADHNGVGVSLQRDSPDADYRVQVIRNGQRTLLDGHYAKQGNAVNAALKVLFGEAWDTWWAANKPNPRPAVPLPTTVTSWKAEITDGSSWASNALRFATKAEAQASGQRTFDRWMAAKDLRVVESTDPVTHRFENGENVAIEKEKTHVQAPAQTGQARGTAAQTGEGQTEPTQEVPVATATETKLTDIERAKAKNKAERAAAMKALRDNLGRTSMGLAAPLDPQLIKHIVTVAKSYIKDGILEFQRAAVLFHEEFGPNARESQYFELGWSIALAMAKGQTYPQAIATARAQANRPTVTGAVKAHEAVRTATTPEAFAAAFKAHRAAMVDYYIDTFGNVVTADDAKELYAPYKNGSIPDRQRIANEIHATSSAIAHAVYTNLIQREPGPDQEPLVLFVVGGTGAGKTTTRETPEVAAEERRAVAVFDGSFSNAENAAMRVQMALDAGKQVGVIYVHRDPVEAWKGARRRAEIDGRDIPDDYHIKSHVLGLPIMDHLTAKFAGQPVGFRYFDNAAAPLAQVTRQELEDRYGAYNVKDVRTAIDAARQEEAARRSDDRGTGVGSDDRGDAGGVPEGDQGTEGPKEVTDGTRDAGDGTGQLPEREGGAAGPDRTGSPGALGEVLPGAGGEPEGTGTGRAGDGGAGGVVAEGVPGAPGDGAQPGAPAPDRGGVVPDRALAPSGNLGGYPGHPPADYQLTPERVAAILGPGRGTVTRVRDNLAAIQIVKALKTEQRYATPEEQDTLAKYVGWGEKAAADFLGDYPQSDWSGSEKKLWQELQDATTPEERARLANSTPYAHFTFDLYRPIWHALERFGFAGGRVLEPSVGSGHAFGFMPVEMRAASTLNAVELEPLTAAIAQALYPSARVQPVGYEQARIASGTQDLVIGNPPFGDFHVVDKLFSGMREFLTKTLHTYFFAKALDHVRPGGYVVFITSRYTMDAPDHTKARRYLMTKAHFVGAIRLPNVAFAKSAKTEVITDLIILQRFTPDERVARNANAFIKAPKLEELSTEIDGQVKNVYRSAWYDAHPEYILGTEDLKGKLYGAGQYNVSATTKDLQGAITTALEQILPANGYEPATTEAATPDVTMAEGDFKPGELRVAPKGGDPNVRIQKVGRDGTLINATPRRVINQATGETGVDAKAVARLAGMIAIRDQLRATIATMRDIDASTAAIEKAQAALKRAYDTFTAAGGAGAKGDGSPGYLNDPHNRRAFEDDPEATNLLELEILEPKSKEVVDKKRGRIYRISYEVTGVADIFDQRTIQAPRAITHVETPQDALLASLGVKTRIDWPYMASIADQTIPELQAALRTARRVFEEPGGAWVSADDYLSGDVVSKLHDATIAAEDEPARFQANVDALTAVQPAQKTKEDLASGGVAITLGSHWVPASDINLFVKHELPRAGNKPFAGQLAGSEAFVHWAIKFTDDAETVGKSHALAVPYGRKARDGSQPYTYGFTDLLKDALNLQLPDLGWWEGRGDDRQYFKDPEGTKAARANLEELRAKWMQWVFENDPVQERLLEMFNTRFNRTVRRVYDGSHLVNVVDYNADTKVGTRTAALPGLALKFPLFMHQLNGIWRALTTGNTLLAHEVGAGKTYEMIVIAMEMRRTGRARKPMITVPTNLLSQWRQAIVEAYPSAKILAFDEKDLASDKRQKAMARIAFGDWDIVLVPHSSFELLKVSDQRMVDVMQRWVDELMDAEREAKKNAPRTGRNRARGNDQDESVKKLANTRKRIEKKIQSKMDDINNSDDTAMTWEELGVDALLVDEAHSFKNLYFFSKMDAVKGVSRSEADKSLDMFVKIQQINEDSGYRNLVFGTATPVMNSIAELYTMQRYLQPQRLRELGLENFDNWYQMFASALPTIEQRPDGTHHEVMRVRSFNNLNLLYKTFAEVMDYISWQDMPYLKLPKLTNGRVEIIETDPHPLYEQIRQWFTDRLQAIRQIPPHIDDQGIYIAPERMHPLTGEGMGRPDNILTIMNDAKKAAIDMRLLLGSDAKDFAGSRVQAVVNRAMEVYRAETDKKGAQLLFLDVGTPKKTETLEFLRGATIEDTTEGAFDDADDVVQEGDTPLPDDDEDAIDLYDAVKRELIKRGVPSREIAFIHQAKGAERLALFAAVNSGQVRFLLASTDKGGVGMNVQKRMAAVHHIDAPRHGRPGDLRQRDGRGIRQGNDYLELLIARYVTSGTTDEWLYGMLNNKSGLISKFMRGDLYNFVDVDPSSLSIEEAQIAATGDERGKELTELRTAAPRLQAQAAAVDRTIAQARAELGQLTGARRATESDLATLRAWLPNYTPLRGDAFAIEVAGQPYTKRTEAEPALDAALVKLPKITDAEALAGQKSTQIGVIGGLRITARRRTYDPTEANPNPPDVLTIFLDLDDAIGEGQQQVISLQVPREGVPSLEGVNLVSRLVNDYEDVAKREARLVSRGEDLTEKITAAQDVVNRANPAKDKAAAAEARILQIETELRAEGILKDAETKAALATPKDGEKPRYTVRFWNAPPKVVKPKVLKTSKVNPDIFEVLNRAGDEKKEPVVGQIIGRYFGVYKKGQQQRLVHLPTGVMFASYAKRPTAVAVAEHLEAIGGNVWNQTEVDALRKALPDHVRSEASRLQNNAEAEALTAAATRKARASAAKTGNAMAIPAAPTVGRTPPPPSAPPVSRRLAPPSQGVVPGAPLPAAAGMTKRRGASFWGIPRAIARLLNPEASGGEAKGAAGTIRHEGALSFRALAEAHEKLRDFKREIDKLSTAQQIQYWDDAEHGRPTGDPEIDAGNQTLRDVTDQFTNELIALDRLKAATVREDYIGRFWSLTPDHVPDFLRQMMGKRPFEGPKSFLKHRTWENFVDGIHDIQAAQARVAAGKTRDGDERLARMQPATYNWVESQLAKIAEMQRVIAAERMLRYEQSAGRAARVLDSLGKKPPKDANGEDWVRIGPEGDPAFTIYGPKTVKVKSAHDRKLMDMLYAGARGMGITAVRAIKLGGQRWGYATGSKVVTRFAGPEGVLMHEIGHVIDDTYGLRGKWVDKKSMKRELQNLADLRDEGAAITTSRKRYLRKAEEKIANLIHAYIHVPETAKKVAPNAYAALDKLVTTTPELKWLKEVQTSGRSLTLATETAHIPIAGFPVVGHVYAPKAAAAVWANHLSTGMRGNPLFDTYLGVANASTQILLGLSGFHFTTIAREALTSRIALSIDALANRGTDIDIAQAAKHLAVAPGAMVMDAVFGRRIMEEYRRPGTHPELAAVLEGMLAGGYRGTAESEFWTGERIAKLKQSFTDAVHAEAKGRRFKGMASLPTDALFAAIELQMKPLMGKYVPWVKTAATYRAVADALAKLPPNTPMDRVREIMGDIVKEMDYRYGQVVYDNHFIHKMVKDLAQAVFLAPGWTFGTLILAGRGIKQIGAIPVRVVKTAIGAGGTGAGGGTTPPGPGGQKEPPELIGSSAQYWIGGVLAFMFINGLITYLYTGQDPKGKDFFGYRDGTTDDEGNANRHILPGYEMRDIYGWGTHPVTTLTNKFKSVLAFMFRLAQNKDYFGNMIYNPDADITTQTTQVAQAAVRDLVTPLSVQNLKEAARRGEHDTAETARNMMGVSPAKREFVRSPAQNRMQEYMARQGRASLTPEEREDSEERRDYREALEKHDQATVDRIEQSGHLSKRQMDAAKLESKESHMQRTFKSLSFDRALEIYELANLDERAALRALLIKKHERVDEAPAADRPGLRARYVKAMGLPFGAPVAVGR